MTSPFDDVKKGESYFERVILRKIFVIFCVVVLYVFGYLCVLDM